MAGKQIPSWLGKKITEAELSRIESAVTAAESKTHAEIVPLIVRSSSVTGQVWMTLSFLFSLVLVFVAIAYKDYLPLEYFNWIALGTLPLAVLLALPLSRLMRVQHAVIPAHDRELQVRRRAWAEFHDIKIASTEKHTGVLIFVSVMERKALILPDEQSAKILTQEACQRIVGDLAGSIGKGEWAKAFETAIAEAGALLAQHMPHQAQDRDELGNSLQIKE